MQGLLELADLPYVGSGVVGSAVAMDKVDDEARVRGCRAAVRRAPSSSATATTATRSPTRSRPSSGYPCFVKPANLGSSVGVSKAPTASSSTPRCDLALGVRRVDRRGGGDRRPRDRGRGAGRRPAGGVGARARSCPATSSTPTPTSTRPTTRSSSCRRRSPTTRSRDAQLLACRAFEACRCEAMARVDLFLDASRARLPRERGQHHPRVHARSRCTRGSGRRPGCPTPSCSTA